MRLYCFACAGASAAPLLRWRRYSPSWLDVVPVERPGRGQRALQPHQHRFDDLVSLLTEDLTSTLPQDYALYGHSVGGLIALGCAHELRARGHPPPCALIVACCAAPTKRDLRRFSQLRTDEDFLEELRRHQGTPPAILADPYLLRMTLDAAAADYGVCETFHLAPTAPLDTSIFVLGGRQDDIERDALAAWSVESSRQVTVETFDGGHFFMRDHEEKFVQYLATLLDSARAPPLSASSPAAPVVAGTDLVPLPER